MNFSSATRIATVLGIAIAASLLSATLASSATSDTTAHRPPVAAQPAAASALSQEAWRAVMLRTPRPRKGCFQASYPVVKWQEVPCAPPTRRTYSVGHGNDFSAKVPGLLTEATGSFDAVNSTGETGIFGPDSYSLQVNSSFFKSPECAGAEIPNNCQGWAQFIYAPSVAGVFIEYWLIHWGNVPCPAGWTSVPPSCLLNTPTMPVPVQKVSDLNQLSLTGTASAGGMDSATLATMNQIYTSAADDTTIHLAQGWNYAEFNIFGDGGSTAATFNAGSNLIVRTSVTDGTQNAPACQGDGYTGETNNLTLVTPCCPYAGAKPAIVFDESNNPGAVSMCANGTSIGDTHLTNFNGLLYDFQASGDFLLAQTDPNFVVQTRQVSGAPTWPNATVNKAVAMKMGDTRVAVCLAPDRLIVDGKPADLPDGKTLALPGAGVTRSGNVYLFTRPNGESVRAELDGAYINVSVNLGHVPVAKVRGLLGNANGNTGADDLAARNGTVLHQPVAFSDLYGTYGDSWRMPAAESLPSQLCGDRNVERGNPQTRFYANNLKPRDAERARAVCVAAGVRNDALLEACTLDVAVLADKAAARVYVRAAPPRAVLRPGPGRGGG